MIFKENDAYEIKYQRNKKTLENEIIIKSKQGGRYQAKYK